MVGKSAFPVQKKITANIVEIAAERAVLLAMTNSKLFICLIEGDHDGNDDSILRNHVFKMPGLYRYTDR